MVDLQVFSYGNPGAARDKICCLQTRRSLNDTSYSSSSKPKKGYPQKGAPKRHQKRKSKKSTVSFGVKVSNKLQLRKLQALKPGQMGELCILANEGHREFHGSQVIHDINNQIFSNSLK